MAAHLDTLHEVITVLIFARYKRVQKWSQLSQRVEKWIKCEEPS